MALTVASRGPQKPRRRPQVAAEAVAPPGPVANEDHAGIEATAQALWDLWRLWRRSHPVRHGTVTQEQHALLRLLFRRGPQPVSALARHLGVTVPSATVATRRLEAAGLVRKERIAKDQRIVTVSLTPDGEDALRRWQDERAGALVDLLSNLRPDERLQLNRLIQRILASGEAQPKA